MGIVETTKTERVCEQCGDIYHVYASDSTRPEQYCSFNCEEDYYREERENEVFDAQSD